MRELLDAGVIGAAGVSNYSLARWRKADAALGRPVISNQVHFSLAHPDALEDLVPFAERENRVVIAYSPLAPGLLGGVRRRQSARRNPGGQPAVRHRESAAGGAAAADAARAVAADIELSAEARDTLTAAVRAFTPASTSRVVADLVKEKLGRRA